MPLRSLPSFFTAIVWEDAASTPIIHGKGASHVFLIIYISIWKLGRTFHERNGYMVSSIP